MRWGPPSAFANHNLPNAMLSDIISVCMGACLGALSRWLLSLALNALFPLIPPGTLLVNLLGSFLMGLCLGAASQSEIMGLRLKPLLLSGFMGSFTTFSTFASEMGALLRHGKIGWLSLGVLLHVGGSIALFLAGLWLGKIIASAAD